MIKKFATSLVLSTIILSTFSNATMAFDYSDNDIEHVNTGLKDAKINLVNKLTVDFFIFHILRVVTRKILFDYCPALLMLKLPPPTVRPQLCTHFSIIQDFYFGSKCAGSEVLFLCFCKYDRFRCSAHFAFSLRS